MPNCISNLITVSSLCGVVGGGLEYVQGFTYESFKNTFDAAHGTPEQHLQVLLNRAKDDFYLSLTAALSAKGIAQIYSPMTWSATPVIGGQYQIKQAGYGVSAHSIGKTVMLKSVRVNIAVGGTYSLLLTTQLGATIQTQTLTQVVLSAGITEFTLPSTILADKVLVTFAQNTPVFAVNKNTKFCKSCSATTACPNLFDIAPLNAESAFNGGNCIMVEVACTCDLECYLVDKIGINFVRSLYGLYVSKHIKQASIWGNNQSLVNYGDTEKEFLARIEAQIEANLQKAVAIMIPIAKNGFNDCVTCGNNTVSIKTNI